METREQIEARWQELWARGEELTERQERLLASMTDMEPTLADRALKQLAEDRQWHERELLALRSAMDKNGGFK